MQNLNIYAVSFLGVLIGYQKHWMFSAMYFLGGFVVDVSMVVIRVLD